jgi:hypothetical protein
MDFGLNHVAKNTEYIHQWISCVPDKIKQLCINPFTENIPNKEYFKFIYHNMAAGLFSGSAENLLKYCDLFKQKTEEIYRDNWYQLEEAVMTMVHKENPDLFDLFYGDYQGIISNYLSPIHNIELILKGAQKCIDSNNTEKAYKIICYCIPYFENNMNSHLIFWYIHQHFIVDYYHNDAQIADSIIKMIQYLRETNYDKILQTLINNKHNINLYKNKEFIIKNFTELE